MPGSFEDLIGEVKSAKKRTIAVAAAQDSEVLEALEMARQANLASAILVGDKRMIENIARENNCQISYYEIIDVPDEKEAVKESIRLVRERQANVLMKGLCSTATLMKAVLEKENGLRSGGLLSHLAIFEISTYHKLILMSDAAINIAPTLEDKIGITQNAISAARQLGIEKPKAAIIGAVEKVNPGKMAATTDAAIISKMAERGQIKNAHIDGPLAVDNAFSKKSCEVKGIVSDVGGDADIAIVPNIEAGNIFYKLMSYLAGAKTAGIIVGAKVPIVLTSRADSDETKFLSIAAAVRAS
jgi:phosphate butyryltransferase